MMFAFYLISRRLVSWGGAFVGERSLLIGWGSELGSSWEGLVRRTALRIHRVLIGGSECRQGSLSVRLHRIIRQSTPSSDGEEGECDGGTGVVGSEVVVGLVDHTSVGPRVGEVAEGDEKQEGPQT